MSKGENTFAADIQQKISLDTGKPIKPFNGNGKRLAIFFFYDKDGIVDGYVDVLLGGLKEVAEDFVVVVNGILSAEGRKRLETHTQYVLVRENDGLDAWAYKEALEFVGWENLRKYEEVVLLNHTIMGPVYPFSEMFDKMAQRKELDFWGITRHLKIPYDPFGFCKYGYIPEHIQSSFIVYRNKFLKTGELKAFWDTLPEIHDYNESVGLYESYFTKYFADMGFLWDTYVDDSQTENLTDQIIMVAPRIALEKYRCPIFKRRSFFQDGDFCYYHTSGEAVQELMDFLKKHTDYDTDLIFENLIRTVNQHDLVRTMGLHYVLPSEKQLAEKVHRKTALLIHAYYMDQMERTCQYASAMPEDADIYINTPNKEKLEEIKKVFSRLPNKVEIRLIENRGRDVSSLLVGFADLIGKYDYLCYYHDKKVGQVSPKSVGSSFCYLVSESTLHGKAYVQNILNTFEENPRLGLLAPVPPCHSAYYFTLFDAWGPNYENTVDLAKEINLNVPISRDKPPVAPLGSVFWFRGTAMKKLFAKNWQYTDFPPEPTDIDGTIMHAVERIHPFVVQDAGFYPAYVMPDFIASMELNMMTHYLRTFNETFSKKGIFGSQMEIRDQLSSTLGFVSWGRFPAMTSGPAYGVKDALKITVNKRFPFLFRETAARFPAEKRNLGLRDAINIWRVKRILRKYN